MWKQIEAREIADINGLCPVCNNMRIKTGNFFIHAIAIGAMLVESRLNTEKREVVLKNERAKKFKSRDYLEPSTTPIHSIGDDSD